MDSKLIVIPALGRALHPGTLYDCRNDTFIPGITLWDKATLHDNVNSRRQPRTDLNFGSSDSLSDKAKLLDVSASLKASILGGLVDVAGAARYIRDNKSSAQQSRVTLQYSQTTKFVELTMNQLSNITYPKVFEDASATHVVTAVLYGAQAFMVFDITASENEDKEEIQGNLNVMVRKIPTLSVEGGGALSMNDKEKQMSDKIKCTFYGDYELEINPTTYIEALEVYRTLPSLLRKRENDAVPVKVWLYPLALLDDKAAKLEREINRTLISQTEAVLAELSNSELACNDLITNPKSVDFQDLKLRLNTFQDMLTNYKVMFLKAVNKLIPAIRGGTEKEQALQNIITIHNKSLFRAEKMDQWLEYNQSEQDLLTLYRNLLSGVPVVKYTALFSNILIDPHVDTVVCFCFTSLINEDPYLTNLNNFLAADEFEKLSPIKESEKNGHQFWYQDFDVVMKMKNDHSVFASFFQANKDEAHTRFVIVSVSDPSSPGTSIHLYRNGKLVDNMFKPVSKPPAPKMSIQNRNLILKLEKSPTGSTVKFRVEYRVIQSTDSDSDEEKWEATETPDAQEYFTLTGFELTSQNWIRYRAISEVGVSEASEPILYSPKGDFKYSLSQIWNFSHLSLVNGLRTQMLDSMVPSWINPSTIKAEVSNLMSNPNIPYKRAIPGGLRTGMALYFQGIVGEEEQPIGISLETGKTYRAESAFHVTLRPNYDISCEAYEHRLWKSGAHYDGCPVIKGSTFVTFIVVKKEGYEVHFNGRRYCSFKHQMPVEKVKTLYIYGDVVMNTFGIVSNWSASSFSKEQSSGISHWELSNIQSDIKYPVCKPDQPYLGPLPGELKTGMGLFFQGVVPVGSKGFEINMKTGSKEDDDIALHLKSNLQSIVCGSRLNGKWELPLSTEDDIFAEGEPFDIFILFTPQFYNVVTNGRMFYEIGQPVQLSKVSTLQISGDVFMNTLGIICVDNADMTINISSVN